MGVDVTIPQGNRTTERMKFYIYKNRQDEYFYTDKKKQRGTPVTEISDVDDAFNYCQLKNKSRK